MTVFGCNLKAFEGWAFYIYLTKYTPHHSTPSPKKQSPHFKFMNMFLIYEYTVCHAIIKTVTLPPTSFFYSTHEMITKKKGKIIFIILIFQIRKLGKYYNLQATNKMENIIKKMFIEKVHAFTTNLQKQKTKNF